MSAYSREKGSILARPCLWLESYNLASPFPCSKIGGQSDNDAGFVAAVLEILVTIIESCRLHDFAFLHHVAVRDHIWGSAVGSDLQRSIRIVACLEAVDLFRGG